MASIRGFKSDVEYLINEIIADSYTCVIINEKVDKDKVFAVISGAVELRNDIIEKINHPAEKNNRKINKKYYAQLRREMMEKVDGLFAQLSGCMSK